MTIYVPYLWSQDPYMSGGARTCELSHDPQILHVHPQSSSNPSSTPENLSAETDKQNVYIAKCLQNVYIEKKVMTDHD